MARRQPFRYAVLLRVRRLQEDQKAFELAGVRREIQNAVEDREFIAREQARMLEEAAAATREPFDGSRIGRYHQYERHLARRSVEKDAIIAEKRREEEARRRELEHATQRKRTVEKLQERDEAFWQSEYQRFEQKLSDETAVNQVANQQEKRRQAS